MIDEAKKKTRPRKRAVRPSPGRRPPIASTVSPPENAVSADGKPVCGAVIRDITDLEQAEEKNRTLLADVQNQKMFLSTLINSITDEVWFANRQGRFTLANPAALREFSLDPDQKMAVEELAKNLEVFRPDGSPRAIEEAPPLRALSGEVVRNQEEIVRTPASSELRYRLVSSTPVKDPQGRIIGAVSVVRDITELKKAEENMRSLSLRQEAILAAVPDIIMEVDAEKVYTWANPAGLEFFGEDVIGKEAADYFMGEQETYALVKPLFNGREEVFYIESWQRRKDGEKRLLAWWCHVLKDAEGNVTGALSTARDITEPQRAEETLRESEGQLHAILENAPDGVYLNDLAGNFLHGNRRTEEIMGYKREEIIGKNMMELNLLAPEDLTKAAKLMQESAKGKSTGPDELTLIKKDGSRITVEINTSVVQRHGQPNVIGFVRDITERKRAEETIQASLREKEILLREIHHRVKNNMQVISSLFNLQAGQITAENARRVLKEGQMRIRSMALVHEKLYQSRDLSKVDFADYLRSLADHLFHFYRVEPGRIRLETHLEPVYLSVNSAVPCGLLVNELVSNSLKHAFPADRKGTVEVGLRRGEDGIVELRVADDGVGFPGSLDFRRTESLGLQIVNLLADQLGGTIELGDGNGTDFRISFREAEDRPKT